MRLHINKEVDKKFLKVSSVNVSYILLVLGVIGSIFYYYSLQSFAKGSYYLIFLSLGVLGAHYLNSYAIEENNKISLNKLLTGARLAYTPVVVVSLLVVTAVFIVMPYSSLYSTVQTRELALYSISLLSNIVVSSGTTNYGLAPDPIYQNPLGQTWLLSLTFQVIASTLLIYFIFSYFSKKNKLKTTILLLSFISFCYFIYKYSEAGYSSYTQLFYSNLAVLDLYWLFGVGGLLYVYHTSECVYSISKDSRRRLKYLVVAVASALVSATLLYNFNYINLSYTIYVVIFYIVVFLIINFISEKLLYLKFNLNINSLFKIIFEYTKTRFYFILLILFPVLAYSKGLVQNYSSLTWVIIVIALLLLGEFLYRTSLKASQSSFLERSFLRSVAYLVFIFVGSSSIIIFVYTNNILLKTQPNSWINSIIFSEKCNTGRLDKNVLSYLSVQERSTDFSCQFPSGGSDPKGKVLVLGDSLAVSLVDGIVEGAEVARWDVDSYASVNCGLGMPSDFNKDQMLTLEDANTCAKLYEKAIKNLEEGHYDAVIVSSSFARPDLLVRYLSFKKYILDLGVPLIQVDFFSSADFYSGKNSSLVNPWADDRYVDINLPNNLQARQLRQQLVDNSTIINLRDKICEPLNSEGVIRCAAAIDGVELFSDRIHLSRNGSLLVSDLVTDALESVTK